MCYHKRYMEPYTIQIGVDDNGSGVYVSQDCEWVNLITDYADKATSPTEGLDKEAYLEECAKCGRVARIFDDGKIELYESYTKEEVARNCKLTAEFLDKAFYYLSLAYETNKLAQELEGGELKGVAEQLSTLVEKTIRRKTQG